MKSLFFLIDGKLLSVFERVVKWFNWLTGKDNFFLARQLAIIQLLLIFAFSIISGNLIFGICFLPFTFEAFLFSRITERERRLEQVERVKNPYLFYGLFFRRWSYTIIALAISIAAVATPKSFVGKTIFITGILLFVSIF